MANLIYYSNEREEFKEEYQRKLPNTESTKIVIKKLLRHFKLWDVNIEFTSGRNNSCAGRSKIRINQETMNNFAVICHEVAHTYQAKKEGFETADHWHTKKHKKIMKRMLNYCKKNGWFENEIKRRTEIKPERPEPSKDEVRKKKIEVLEKRILDCERKIKRNENLIKKNRRRIASLRRFI